MENSLYEAPEAKITGVSDTMLMESGTEMPYQVKQSEMRGNESLIGVPHGKGNKTIGFGIDIQQNPKMGANVLKRAGASKADIARVLSGDSSVRLPDDVVTKASDYMYSYKYKQAKNIIPKFDTFSDKDQKLLVNMHYSGAIKKARYLEHDQTRKAIWNKLKVGDIDGMKELIRTSNEPYAKKLRKRLVDRGQYSLMNENDYLETIDEAQKIFNEKGEQAGIEFLKSQDISFKNILAQSLQYNGKDGKLREILGIENDRSRPPLQ